MKFELIDLTIGVVDEILVDNEVAWNAVSFDEITHGEISRKPLFVDLVGICAVCPVAIRDYPEEFLQRLREIDEYFYGETIEFTLCYGVPVLPNYLFLELHSRTVLVNVPVNEFLETWKAAKHTK
jgi:hypothetical protein